MEQTFDDFELIVVDDGSTDESPEILTRLAKEDSRIHGGDIASTSPHPTGKLAVAVLGGDFGTEGQERTLLL